MIFKSRLFLSKYLLAFLSFYSQFSSADYYWIISSSPHFDSAAEACAWRAPLFAAEYNAELISYSVHTFYSDTLAQCKITLKDGPTTFSDTSSSSNRPSRQGTPCVLPKTYDQATRTCVSPPEPEPDLCEPTIGQTIFHEFSFSEVGADGNPSTDPPVTVCKNECQYAHTFGDFTSKRDFGPPDKLVGSFEYKGNGVQCTASATDPSGFNEPPSKDPVNNPPAFDSDNNCTGWESQPDGTLKRACTSNTSYADEGEVECKGGTAGSSFSSSVTCTPVKGKSPEKVSTDVTEDATKQTNPDGSTNTVTESTTDKTSCKGTSPCTSTSKTETHTSGTNPDGSPGNDSTSCTGVGCNPDDPTEGEDEGEDEVERTAAAGSCESALQCSGDPIDCEILAQQKEQKCHAEAMSDFDGSKSDIESLFQGEQFQLETSEIQAPGFINSGTRFLPTSCPPPEQLNMSFAGGHTYQMSYQPLCTFASDFSFIIVTFVALWCAVYVGRAFGGE